MPDLIVLMGTGRLPFLEAGYFIVLVTLLVVSALAFLVIVVPLVRVGTGRGGARTVVYFACLGAGYMLVEVMLMQRLVLLVGEPVTTAAVVLGSLLVGSGGGSIWSGRYLPGAPRRAAIVVAAVLIVAAIGNAPELLLPLPSPLRLISLCLFLLPVGFVMGVPFPTGLRSLVVSSPAGLPWAWGVNGALSVVGGALAPVLAVEAGFTGVFAVAAALYLLAGVSGIPAAPGETR